MADTVAVKARLTIVCAQRWPAECDLDSAVRRPPGIARIALAGIWRRASISVSFFASVALYSNRGFNTSRANCKLNPFRLVLNRGRYVRLRRRTVDHDKIEVIDKIEVT
jgi:hypothetical protein